MKVMSITATVAAIVASCLTATGCDDDTDATSSDTRGDVTASAPQVSTDDLPKPVLSLLGDQSSEIVGWGCTEVVRSRAAGGPRTTSCTVHIGDLDTVKKFIRKGDAWVERPEKPSTDSSG